VDPDAELEVLENGKTAALSAPQAKAAALNASKTPTRRAAVTRSISTSLVDAPNSTDARYCTRTTPWARYSDVKSLDLEWPAAQQRHTRERRKSDA
jgi:hypothetical protein